MDANFADDPLDFLLTANAYYATEEGKAANEAFNRAYAAEIEAKCAAERAKVCPRCNGRGILQDFRHVANGECFTCHGKGKI